MIVKRSTDNHGFTPMIVKLSIDNHGFEPMLVSMHVDDCMLYLTMTAKPISR